MSRSLVASIFIVFAMLAGTRAAFADAAGDRSAIAEALSKLSSYAADVARTAQRSEDRAVRKKFASRATEIADDLDTLASRTRKDVSYAALAKDTQQIGRDAQALIELADEAEDKTERKSLRTQAQALEQGIAATRKVLEALARDNDKPAKPAKPQPMPGASFAQLIEAIRAASFDDDKVAVVRHAAQTNWFSANQVGSVMDQISFDDGKIDAAAAMWPRIVDPENSFSIFNKLAFDSSKEKLRKRVGK